MTSGLGPVEEWVCGSCRFWENLDVAQTDTLRDDKKRFSADPIHPVHTG